MPEIIRAISQITPEWLTEVLSQNNTLTAGKVESVQISEGESMTAKLAYLRLTFSGEAAKSTPAKLILKMPKLVDWMKEECEHEVKIYQAFAVFGAPVPSLVGCFSAEFDSEGGLSHLLLEDISERHSIMLERDEVIAGRVPEQTRLDEALDCLAKFHAFWWEHPNLGEGVFARHYWLKDEASFNALFEKRNRELGLFVDKVGANFSPELIILYKETLAEFPALYRRYIKERLAKRENVTLVHGDCYLNQFFCPKQTGTYPAYLLDMQSISAYFPADDLAHMLAAFWTVEQRKSVEEVSLRFYHQCLQAYGVKTYTWENLLQDYKLSIIYLLFEAIWNQTSGSPENYWRKKLQCLTESLLEQRNTDLNDER
jgi:Ecdysteroid kinase-like family